jgi:hypothetical protein
MDVLLINADAAAALMTLLWLIDGLQQSNSLTFVHAEWKGTNQAHSMQIAF